ncbi:RNA-directed DNA polymerase, eukaryota, nucleotide-binding alpha-beta plait domain protein [Tanacetum coccineum]
MAQSPPRRWDSSWVSNTYRVGRRLCAPPPPPRHPSHHPHPHLIDIPYSASSSSICTYHRIVISSVRRIVNRIPPLGVSSSSSSGSAIRFRLGTSSGAYGKVIDVSIPNRKSKAGKRFAFVHFIKVEYLDRLVENLSTIWIGRLRLHANIVWFERTSFKPTAQPKGIHRSSPIGFYVSVLKTGKTGSYSSQNTSPSLILDESCILENDCKLSVMGKVKEFDSISNSYFILAKEGFYNFSLSYLGGMWVLIEYTFDVTKQKFLKHVGVGSWFSSLDHANPKFVSEERIVLVDIKGIPLHARSKNTFNKIGLKWGDFMDIEDIVTPNMYQKRLCIKTKEKSVILDSFKVIIQGKVYWVRAKEVNGWTPIFREEKKDYYSSDEESVKGGLKDKNRVYDNGNPVVNDSDVEEVSETIFTQGDNHLQVPEQMNENEVNSNMQSEDPFQLYGLLNKKKDEGIQNSEDNLQYPPGFTPVNNGVILTHDKLYEGENTNDFQKDQTRDRGSILNLMDELLKVGQEMGYNMDGCIENIGVIIGEQ